MTDLEFEEYTVEIMGAGYRLMYYEGYSDNVMQGVLQSWLGLWLLVHSE